MSIDQFSAFLDNLGAFESGIDTSQSYADSYYEWLGVFDPQRGGVDPLTVDLSNPEDLAELQYHVHNSLGFLGKYQFGEPLLIDLGYYTPAESGYYGSTATNEWEGTWTGKHGVWSKADFMSNVQEMAIREAFAMNMTVIETRLAQAGKSIDDFLGQTFTYTQNGVEQTATVTVSGILASAHLQGPGGVANLLLNHAVSYDEYGTNILSYMDKFGGFSTPFGTEGDDVLSGSDLGETFYPGAGDNFITTGDGADHVVISDHPTGTDTIVDFDPNKDVISFNTLNDVTFSDLNFENTGDGTLITLPSGQTITLQNVAPDNIDASHFIAGVIPLRWEANSGDTVISHFNLEHDLIDLNYAFGLTNLAIYSENNSTVIEVVGNQQRLILNDVSLGDLKAYHFIKAPIGFSDYFFENDGMQTPTPDTTQDSGSSSNNDNGANDGVIDPVVDPDPIPTSGQVENVYSFSWNWGAHDVITDFNLDTDAVDLSKFWSQYQDISIYENSAGDTVIDLSNLNNQTITLTDIALTDLTEQHVTGLSGEFEDAFDSPDGFESPVETDTQDVGAVFQYTWQWGNESVIENFDVSQDAIDLQNFWTDYANFELYDDENGNAVIDLTDLNHQKIILNDVSTEDLNASHFIGVSGQFDDALSEGNHTVPSDSTPENTSSNDADVYAFTWDWGSHDAIDGFNVESDIIDLTAFWTGSTQVNVHDDAQGDAVIDLTALNNQTITLTGVSSDELTDHNILF